MTSLLLLVLSQTVTPVRIVQPIDGGAPVSVQVWGTVATTGGAGSGSTTIDGGFVYVDQRSTSNPWIIGGTSTTRINDGTDTALVSGSGALNVTCDNCGGSTFEDNDAFTPGTSAVSNAGLEVDDTATTAVSENSAGAQRMTTFRAAHQVIRDGAGNERSANVTASNALVVDGSASTQPVSGTVTANLAAGTNNIGDVDVLTLPSVTVGTFPDNEPVAQGTAASSANRWKVQLTDGTDDNLVSAAGALVVDGSAVTQPVSGTVTANLAAGTNNIGDVDVLTLPSVTIGTFPDNEPINVAQMNGTAVTMGNGISGTGVQRVTLASDSTGTVAVTQATASSLNAEVQGDAAHAAAVSGNPILAGAYAEADAAALDSTGVAEGEATRLKATVEGQLLVRIDHPNRWSCTVDAATADTQCQATATSLYLTDVWLTNGATAQGLAITYGTGAACATGRTVIFPTTYLAVNGGAATNLITAYKVPASQNVCCDTNGSTSFSCRLGGFTAP